MKRLLSGLADLISVAIGFLVGRWAVGISTPAKDIAKTKRLVSAMRWYTAYIHWRARRALRYYAEAMSVRSGVVLDEFLGISYFRLRLLRRRIRLGAYADDRSIGVAYAG